MTVAGQLPPSAATSSRVAHVELHGRRVAYRRVGTGPALLLVHGLGATMSAWDGVDDALASSHTVVTVDLPGHGSSAPPAGDYSLGAYASVLRDLLDALGHDTATIVGHSFGGGTAMQFAYQFPTRSAGLVLVGSGGLGREINGWLRAATLPGAELALRAMTSGPLSWLLRSGRGVVPVPTEERSAAAHRTFLHALRAVADHRGQRAAATDRLYLLDRAPTLLVWGRHDDVIPVAHAERAHEAMPNSRLEIFEEAGHCPHREETDRFVALVREFVTGSVPVRPPSPRGRARPGKRNGLRPDRPR